MRDELTIPAGKSPMSHSYLAALISRQLNNGQVARLVGDVCTNKITMSQPKAIIEELVSHELQMCQMYRERDKPVGAPPSKQEERLTEILKLVVALR